MGAGESLRERAMFPVASQQALRYAGKRQRNAALFSRFAVIGSAVLVLIAVGVIAEVAHELPRPVVWSEYLVMAGLPLVGGLVACTLLTHRRRKRQLGGSTQASYRAWRELDIAMPLLGTTILWAHGFNAMRDWPPDTLMVGLRVASVLFAAMLGAGVVAKLLRVRQ